MAYQGKPLVGAIESTSVEKRDRKAMTVKMFRECAREEEQRAEDRKDKRERLVNDIERVTKC